MVDSSGVTSRLMAWSCAFVSADCSPPNTPCTFDNSSPAFSSASIVLANVGGCGLLTTASTSLRFCAIASLNAGRKCSGLISWNGGTWNGVVHSFSSGLSVAGAAAGCAHAGATSVSTAISNRAIRLDMLVPLDWNGMNGQSGDRPRLRQIPGGPTETCFNRYDLSPGRCRQSTGWGQNRQVGATHASPRAHASPMGPSIGRYTTASPGRGRRPP